MPDKPKNLNQKFVKAQLLTTYIFSSNRWSPEPLVRKLWILEEQQELAEAL